MRGWCIIGTVLCDGAFGEVDVREVHHWDGCFDDAFGGGGCESGASLGRFFVMASLRFGYQKNASQLMAPVKSGKWLKIIREICGYDPFLGRMGGSKFRRQ